MQSIKATKSPATESSFRVKSVIALVATLIAAPGFAAERLVAGMNTEGGSVKVFDAAGNALTIAPFPAGFSGGVRVALGDVNGDGIPDIVAGSGPGITAAVRVFDGATLFPIRELEPFGSQFMGGVYVAAGDVNGDGRIDIIVGAGTSSSPVVRVFDGRSNAELVSFSAYEASYQGGVYVAAGDLNGDGKADIAVGPAANFAPVVKVFNGSGGAVLREFSAFDPGFLGGVSVAVGDFNGDGKSDISVGAGPSTTASGGGPRVRVFDGTSAQILADFFAYTPSFSGGVRVAMGDINGDGRDDIITAPGAGFAATVSRFLAPSAASGGSFLAFDSGYSGGVFVANEVVPSSVFSNGFE